MSRCSGREGLGERTHSCQSINNFGKDITLTPVNIAKANSLGSDARLNQRILDVELLVTQAYLDYAFAQAELEVFKQSLVFAQDLFENNKKQVDSKV